MISTAIGLFLGLVGSFLLVVWPDAREGRR
jgi:hypothetical protein